MREAPISCHRFLVAPMMDQTDRHCRYFLRQLTRRAVLYTEMITAAAVVNGDRQGLLAFDGMEHPLALQLGGSDPQQMAEAARIGEQFGYGEININVGCPSDRVRSGRFGACLMAEPELVARCVAHMQRAVNVPVTVKCRLGIDRQDDYESLHRFVATVADAGCDTFIVHARKAWLSGLSPRQNREIPPLRHDRVHQLKADFQRLQIILNGGLTAIDQCQAHLGLVDGVMLGREPYRNPYLLASVDRSLFGDGHCPPTRDTVVDHMLDYAGRLAHQGLPVHRVTRHMLGLYQGQPGARRWRRYLSDNATRPGAEPGVLREARRALEQVRDTHPEPV